jgi:carboxyl-terminal processing protease
MSKRNLVWILAVILLILLFWQMPDTVQRQESLYEAFAPLADVRAKIKKNYVENVEDDGLLNGAIQGMVQQLDPFSRYIPPSDMERFDDQTNGTVNGIGIFPEENANFLTVLSPLEDSPASRAGILPGDQILRIDGVSTRNMTWEEASKILGGPAGTKITLEVRHELTGLVEELVLTRDAVHIYSVKGFVRKQDGNWNYLLDPKHGIGYIRITNFMSNTAEEVDQAYRDLLQQGLRGLIIDLRFDPGGLLKTAVEIANRFLNDGVIVSTRGRYQEEMVWKATTENTYKPVPVAVLVNRFSASAAEILSGALRDHKRATIIGERTYGKGSVQTLLPLENGYGAIKLTTAYYYLPCGRCIHRKPGSTIWGVEPNIEIPLTAEELLAVKKSQTRSDIFWGRLPETRTATEEAVNIPKPEPLMIDRQLEKAIEVLRKAIADETSATTKANTSQPKP